MSNAILNKIFDDHFHLLRDFQRIWLSLPNLELFSEKLHAKGVAFGNCWAFVDGTVRPVYGAAEGKQHDSAMLTMSNLHNQLVQYSRKADGEALCIYGDPSYPLHLQLQSPFKNQNLTPQQAVFNKSMSTVRASVEWVFGEILTIFPSSVIKRI